MDLREIKEIIQREGGKIIIVENDTPQLVVMSFEEFKAKSEKRPAYSEPVRRQAAEVELPMAPEPENNGHSRGDLSIDDLPL